MFGVKYAHEKLALILGVVSTIAGAQTNEPVSSSARPLVYANFDPQIQSVNLTPNSDNSACPMIDFDQYPDGFRTSKILPYYAHLGGAICWWFPFASQWLSVGFGLSKEDYIEFFYNLDTEEDLKEDRKRKIPNKVSEIESWKSGEAIYFDSMGAALGLAKENSKSFAYEMKLEKEDVKEVYELMMKGDFRKAQELADQERDDIQKLDDTTWKSQRRFGFVGVGVPYFPIFAIGGTSQRQEQQVDRVTTWDATDDIDEGLFQSERFIRLAIGHRKLRKQFKAQRKESSFLDWDNGGVRVTTSKYTGLFQYEYQSDMTGEKDIARVVKKLQKNTLLEDELCVQIPKIEKRTRFRKVLLKMELSDHFMRKLMA